MTYGCIGERLGHSFSREIHGELTEEPYELKEIAPDALDAFMNTRNFLGINVTIPYKTAVIPYLESISAEAEAIGAVNTILNKNGSLIGHNTDFYGLSALIQRIGVPLKGKKVAILGSGGTARTARAVAKSMDASVILTVSRTEKPGCITYEELFASHRDVTYIMNTTPAGMYPHEEGMPLDPAQFSKLCGLADVIYNPLRSGLVLSAQRMGIPAEGGLYMLVAQAVRASELFLDRSYPTNTVERVYERILRKKEQIVLIGMPGCGKSTVGGLLSKILDRPLIDVDAEIVSQCGTSISDIFEKIGEKGFRDLETEVLTRVLRESPGAIIATGGGAILREENVIRMKHNGHVFFLDRPLADLLPTEDRPLANTKEAITARYRERYSKYLAAADTRIPIEEEAAEVAKRIEREYRTT